MIVIKISKEEIIIRETGKPDQEDNKEQATITNVSSRVKKSKEEIDLAININKWGFAFMFLFAGLLAYIVISGFIGIFPFDRPDPLANKVVLEYSLVLTLMLVCDLLFLGLGIYFGWMRTPVEDVNEKQPLSKKEEEETQQEVIFSDKEIDDSLEEQKEE